MRSRAPPVADAARRSTRSGRKNRASEQREDFFGHRKAVGANAPAATLGAYLCAVRTMLCIVRIQHCKRQKGVRQGGRCPPCPYFGSFCTHKRNASAARGAYYAFAKGSTAPTGEMKLLPFAGNPSVTATPCQLPLHRGAFGCADRRDEIWCEGGSRCAGAGLRLAEEFRRQAATPSAFYRIQQKCRRIQTNVCNLRGDVLH